MSKVIAVCNQKGGVGKTVTTVNLGIGLAKKGRRVLLIAWDTSSLTRWRKLSPPSWGKSFRMCL